MSAPALEAPAELLTLTCEECGAEITGKPRGAGSAQWKLGTHLRTKHGIQGRGRKRRGQPSQEEHEANPVIGAIREAAADVGIGKKGTPNAEELAAGLGKGLHIATMSAAAWVATTDPTISHDEAGDAYRNQIVDTLTLKMDAAKGVMTPLGRVFASTRANKRYGRTIVDNVDVVGSLFELAMIGRAWAEYFKVRQTRIQMIAEANTGAPTLSMAPAPAPPTAGQDVPAPASGGGEWVPGPTQGKVLTAADVEAMRGRAS